VKGDRVFLADPALGRMTMLAARFEKIWKDGIGLVLSKPGKEDPGPLALADDEDAVKADTEGLKSSFSADQIGRVLGKGEW
jgi:predicted double-glycine peptidase